MYEGIISFVIGIVAGLAGSMLGLGGGFILVPTLTIIYGTQFIKYCVVASLSAIILTSLMSTIRYSKYGFLKEDLTAVFSLPTILGAIFGSLTLRVLNPSIMSIIFGLLIIGSLIAMTLRKNKEDALKENLYSKYKQITIIPIFLSGFASNLLGIGGGLINVPALTSLGKLPIKTAIAVSTSLMCYSAVIGVTNGFINGLFLPYIALPVALGVSIGAYLGPLFTAKTRTRTLRLLFIILATYLAIRMILRGLGVSIL